MVSDRATPCGFIFLAIRIDHPVGRRRFIARLFQRSVERDGGQVGHRSGFRFKGDGLSANAPYSPRPVAPRGFQAARGNRSSFSRVGTTAFAVPPPSAFRIGGAPASSPPVSDAERRQDDLALGHDIAAPRQPPAPDGQAQLRMKVTRQFRTRLTRAPPRAAAAARQPMPPPAPARRTARVRAADRDCR